jgi:hypothetical protein
MIAPYVCCQEPLHPFTKDHHPGKATTQDENDWASRSTPTIASVPVRTLAQSSEQMLDNHHSFGKPVAERCHD